MSDRPFPYYFRRTVIVPITNIHHAHDAFAILDHLRGPTHWYLMCDMESAHCVVLPDPVRVGAALLIQRALRAYWRRRRDARALAVAMGLHARLGAGSPMAKLDADIVGAILGQIAI